MSEGFDLSGATVEGVRMGVGNHICWIRDFEYKDNSKGSKQLVVQLVSFDNNGETKDYIQIGNKNATAKEIAMRRLKSLLTHAGHVNPDHPGKPSDLIAWAKQGVKVGIRMEIGDDWVNNKGETKRGSAQLMGFGAYFDPGRAQAASEGSTTNQPASKQDLDDEIPF